MRKGLTLGFVAEATGGRLLHADPETEVRGISTDTRKVDSGDLLVALRGERFDAHDFLTGEIGSRAACCLVDRPLPFRCARIGVDDTRRALGRLAAGWRRRFSMPVIAITGSNGKTTTRRFLRTLLSPLGKVCASPASFNNDIGVPLSLLRIDEDTAAGVFEVGTNHPGEIRPLARMIAPEHAVLTFVGRSHLEHFGTVRAVAGEKAALGEELPVDGTLFVNGDIPFLEQVLARVRARVVRAGFGRNNDWRITRHRLGEGGMEFTLESERWTHDFFLGVLGAHHLVNAALALAAGSRLGLSPRALAEGLARCKGEPGRLEWRECGGVGILDDSYNANADSAIGALRTLADIPARRARLAVLGEMGELGEQSEALHREVGRAAADCRLDCLLGIGERAGAAVEAARERGLSSAETHPGWESAARALLQRLQPGDAVLVKASRSVRLERLVEHLERQLERGTSDRMEPAA